MSEPKVNIINNNTHHQNYGFNVKLISEVKSKHKELTWYKAFSKFMTQRLHYRRKKWEKKLLFELTNEYGKFKSANDLGISSKLDTVAYPLLAKLHRKELVETQWHQGTIEYRLTAKGHVYSSEVLG